MDRRIFFFNFFFNKKKKKLKPKPNPHTAWACGGGTFAVVRWEIMHHIIRG